MEKDIWLKSSFTKKNLPDWTCPHCSKGILKGDTFKHEETALSRSWHSEEDWYPEFVQYSFTGSLVCSSCKEFVAFLGKGEEEFHQYYDGNLQKYVEENYSLFYPKFFHPTLQLFKIAEECPKEIEESINDSFALYWNDLGSCANKIRVSLELLLNKFNIKKTFINQHRKRQRLSLHKRIEEFKKIKPDIAELLLAIKWIGNTGSHIGELEKIDILETYEMLELALNKLYDNKEDELKKMAKEINKRKGKRKRK